MNHFSFDEIALGQECCFTVNLTQAMMEHFFMATGDNSPIHVSQEAAKARGHKAPVVYGMLCAGLFSTLAGVHLPGSRCLLHSVEAKFAKPVYVGDVLLVCGKVEEKNETFKTLLIRANIVNQNGQKVTRGIIKCGVC